MLLHLFQDRFQQPHVALQIELLPEIAETMLAQDALPVTFYKVEGIFAFGGFEDLPVHGGHGSHVKFGVIQDKEGAAPFQMVFCIFNDPQTDLVGEPVDDKTDEHLVIAFTQLKRLVNPLIQEPDPPVAPETLLEPCAHFRGDVHPQDASALIHISRHQIVIGPGPATQVKDIHPLI